MSDSPRYLIVRLLSDRSEVHRVEVTGFHESSIESVMMGMLRNLRDDFFVADNKAEE